MKYDYLEEIWGYKGCWHTFDIGAAYLKEDTQAKHTAKREEARRMLLGELEERIRKADAERAKQRVPQIFSSQKSSTDVKGLIEFFNGKATPSKSEAMKKLDEDVIRFRAWLTRSRFWMVNGKLEEPQTGRVVTVAYDNQLTKEFTQVEIQGGKLRMASPKAGAPRPAKESLLDTTKMSSYVSGPGSCVYVMSQERNLHVHEAEIGHYHHSSLLGGAPVFAAGEMEVEKGKIKLLTNKSGHYAPDFRALDCVLSLLQHENVELDFPIIEHIDDTSSMRHANAGAYLDSRMLGNDSRPEFISAIEFLTRVTPPAAAASAASAADGEGGGMVWVPDD